MCIIVDVLLVLDIFYSFGKYLTYHIFVGSFEQPT